MTVGTGRQLARARQFKVAYRNFFIYYTKHKRLHCLGGSFKPGRENCPSIRGSALFVSNLIIINFYLFVNQKVSFNRQNTLYIKFIVDKRPLVK